MRNRFRFAIAALVASVLLPLSAQASDEDDVRQLIDREIAGWAAFDAHAVSSCYSADTIWQNPFGVRIHGAADLERFLTSLFGRAGYRHATDTKPAHILDLRITAPGVATVWSDEQGEGQIDDASGKAMAPRHSFYLEVVKKVDGQWKITNSMIMDLVPLPKH